MLVKRQRQISPRAALGRNDGRAVWGFTLTEMLVVIAIVVLLATMVMPAFTEMLQSNRASTAKALIRTMLARAQAYAVAHQKYAGIRFQFDRDGWQQGKQYMVLIEKAPAGGGASEYNAVPDVKTVTLPEGVGVISNEALIDDWYLDDDGGDGPELILEGAATFAIVFSPTGQLVIKQVQIWDRNSDDSTFGSDVDVYSNPVPPGPPAPLLFYDEHKDFVLGVTFVSVPWCVQESSAAGFYIFEVEAMADVGAGARFTDYVQDLEPLLVNRYTAGLIDE